MGDVSDLRHLCDVWVRFGIAKPHTPNLFIVCKKKNFSDAPRVDEVLLVDGVGHPGARDDHDRDQLQQLPPALPLALLDVVEGIGA